MSCFVIYIDVRQHVGTKCCERKSRNTHPDGTVQTHRAQVVLDLFKLSLTELEITGQVVNVAILQRGTLDDLLFRRDHLTSRQRLYVVGVIQLALVRVVDAILLVQVILVAGGVA